MNTKSEIISRILTIFNSSGINKIDILTVLLFAIVLAIYEYFVYQLVSHRAFYNRSFNITITVLPLFISTIIMVLQSNLIVTLGTIGALAILRFRTAVKDPTDMIYLMWSVHIGIMCGCNLFIIAVLTSILVTLLLIAMNHINIGQKPYVVVFNTTLNNNEVEEMLKNCTKSYRIKSRNYTKSTIDYVVEFKQRDISLVSNKLKENEIETFSIIEYDSEDII